LGAARAARCATPVPIFRRKEYGRREANVKAIREGVKVLALQPAIGRAGEDMEPEFREWLIDFGDSGYTALYRCAGETAVILAVRHQREAGY
jgi:plasmid stabilization system protein ParE